MNQWIKAKHINRNTGKAPDKNSTILKWKMTMGRWDIYKYEEYISHK